MPYFLKQPVTLSTSQSLGNARVLGENIDVAHGASSFRFARAYSDLTHTKAK
jgi:hypothetical protein